MSRLSLISMSQLHIETEAILSLVMSANQQKEILETKGILSY